MAEELTKPGNIPQQRHAIATRFIFSPKKYRPAPAS
ncbi:hypothetical protein LTSEUGA_4873, partial [Salmonella enterica subsp. enterica serovar Uganda str. R8-3404]